jgi:hypothetical protein
MRADRWNIDVRSSVTLPGDCFAGGRCYNLHSLILHNNGEWCEFEGGPHAHVRWSDTYMSSLAQRAGHYKAQP